MIKDLLNIHYYYCIIPTKQNGIYNMNVLFGM